MSPPIPITLTDEQLGALMEQSAQRGAQVALRAVGLGDEEAAQDVHTLRALLSGMKILTRGALAKLGAVVLMGLVGLIVFVLERMGIL